MDADRKSLPELWQTEWCPASARVRGRLTELGIDYVARQVPVERADRGVLRRRAGADSVPALALADGSWLVGEEEILAWLRANVAEPAEAAAHRARAARARRRFLDEHCT